MSESIDELETELEKQDNTLTANRFRELMDTLDVDEGAQELALAILKEEGLQAVQVQEHGGMKSKVTRAGGGVSRTESVCNGFTSQRQIKLRDQHHRNPLSCRSDRCRTPRSPTGVFEARPFAGLQFLP